eukprot:GSMAST32.ASY1.ANO1.1406.1 assembled CDS
MSSTGKSRSRRLYDRLKSMTLPARNSPLREKYKTENNIRVIKNTPNKNKNQTYSTKHSVKKMSHRRKCATISGISSKRRREDLDNISTPSLQKTKLVRKTSHVPRSKKKRPRYNTLQRSANATVKVFIRVRPMKETRRSEISLKSDGHSNEQRFTFDRVFGSTSTQKQVFESVAMPVVQGATCGINGSIFAYGQTGSGKTHTMFGPECQYNFRGIVPRVLESIFETTKSWDKKTHISASSALNNSFPKVDSIEIIDLMDESKSERYLELVNAKANLRDRKMNIKLSLLEIYRENITDLFLQRDGERDPITNERISLPPPPTTLQLREDASLGVYSAVKAISEGLERRRVGSTTMNSRSSRSHVVLEINIEEDDELSYISTGRRRCTKSRLHLVDLAGSERQCDTDTRGVQLKEAASINKSLSTLGAVIMALVDVGDGVSKYVRYRDSKLTFLLRDSLGGNSRTCIIAAVSSEPTSASQTLSTLRFAQRAKFIKNKPKKLQEVLSATTKLAQETNVTSLNCDVEKQKNTIANVDILAAQRALIKVLKERIQLLEQNKNLSLQAETEGRLKIRQEKLESLVKSFIQQHAIKDGQAVTAAETGHEAAQLELTIEKEARQAERNEAILLLEQSVGSVEELQKQHVAYRRMVKRILGTDEIETINEYMEKHNIDNIDITMNKDSIQVLSSSQNETSHNKDGQSNLVLKTSVNSKVELEVRNSESKINASTGETLSSEPPVWQRVFAPWKLMRTSSESNKVTDKGNVTSFRNMESSNIVTDELCMLKECLQMAAEDNQAMWQRHQKLKNHLERQLGVRNVALAMHRNKLKNQTDQLSEIQGKATDCFGKQPMINSNTSNRKINTPNTRNRLRRKLGHRDSDGRNLRYKRSRYAPNSAHKDSTRSPEWSLNSNKGRFVGLATALTHEHKMTDKTGNETIITSSLGMTGLFAGMGQRARAFAAQFTTSADQKETQSSSSEDQTESEQFSPKYLDDDDDDDFVPVVGVSGKQSDENESRQKVVSNLGKLMASPRISTID